MGLDMSHTFLLDKLEKFQDCHVEAAQEIRRLEAEVEKLREDAATTTAGILIDLLKMAGMDELKSRQTIWAAIDKDRVQLDEKLRITKKIRRRR